MTRFVSIIALLLASAVFAFTPASKPVFACTPDGYGGCLYTITAYCAWGHQTFQTSSGLSEVTSAGWPTMNSGYTLVNSDDSPQPPASSITVRQSFWHNGYFTYGYLYEYGYGGYGCG